MKFNNVDLEKVSRTMELLRSEPDKSVRTIEVSGSWLTEPSEVQFIARCRAEAGEFKIEVDSPGFLGGSGSRPGPMHYCLVGMTSCFMATLVGVSAEKGVKLTTAEVKGSCEIDFSKPLGLSDKPIVRSVRFEVRLLGDSPREVLEQLVEEAKERCPAIYSLRTPIEPQVKLF
ncbi:MAG: OsmC family protein [Thaumarchaeota archaeon]|nr:OsmC family protein [Candidatus Calditenuaceae archaeon]MDW8041734.1 OsmC family protein [Nitrososphaerota archaeon]